jgi:hypothetical protein
MTKLLITVPKRQQGHNQYLIDKRDRRRLTTDLAGSRYIARVIEILAKVIHSPHILQTEFKPIGLDLASEAVLYPEGCDKNVVWSLNAASLNRIIALQRIPRRVEGDERLHIRL